MLRKNATYSTSFGCVWSLWKLDCPMFSYKWALRARLEITAGEHGYSCILDQRSILLHQERLYSSTGHAAFRRVHLEWKEKKGIPARSAKWTLVINGWQIPQTDNLSHPKMVIPQVQFLLFLSMPDSAGFWEPPKQEYIEASSPILSAVWKKPYFILHLWNLGNFPQTHRPPSHCGTLVKSCLFSGFLFLHLQNEATRLQNLPSLS